MKSSSHHLNVKKKHLPANVHDEALQPLIRSSERHPGDLGIHRIDSVRAARKVRLQIMDACERLAQNPAIGHSREDLTERAVKFSPAGSYLIVYDPEKRPLEIVRVLHGALDIPRLLESAGTGS